HYTNAQVRYVGRAGWVRCAGGATPSPRAPCDPPALPDPRDLPDPRYSPDPPDPPDSRVTYPVTPRPYTACMAQDDPQDDPQDDHQLVANDWVSFPGGELEGKRPTTLCPACRKALAEPARAKQPGGANG